VDYHNSATFRRIVKHKSTEDFRWLPYATTLLSTSLWTFYGLLKPGGLLVVTVNGAGAALEAAYVTLYLVYAPRETKVCCSIDHGMIAFSYTPSGVRPQQRTNLRSAS